MCKQRHERARGDILPVLRTNRTIAGMDNRVHFAYNHRATSLGLRPGPKQTGGLGRLCHLTHQSPTVWVSER